MNRKDRNLLAQNLRHYLSGQISNFEFMDNTSRLHKSNDKAVVEVDREFWFAYDDLREHKNIGKDKLSKENENHIIRFILFLKSDNEYEWKDPKFPNPINWFLNLISFGLYPKNKNIEINEIKEAGDKEVWPFYYKSKFENEINNPKYFKGVTTPQQEL